ncbi:MAG: hypothetical protein M1837_004567 [Sclerophora amabilis]|nr:MAG: hypothetical protein M1837_004567 [Sclerophora amabilis]
MAASVASVPKSKDLEDINAAGRGTTPTSGAPGDFTNGLSNPAQPGEDPFVATPPQNNHHPHRFSRVDTQLFDLNESSSPSHIMHALEAHLAETDRRIQDTSQLGTALVQQRKDLSARLKDVEKRQGETEIGPELRQKLKEVEREYNEVGRESARASLGPKQWLSGGEGSANPSTTGDNQRPGSPSTFSSQANHSPSKVNVPSRKNRNQPSNRVHDIEFATEISTSLLSQVRNLQAILAEREETVKNINLEKSRLEVEAEGYAQRLRALDESEQRYKDENWALETQRHELLAAATDGADREQKLNQSLSTLNAEKSAAQKELDELKQAHGKLAEESTHIKKQHESEMLGLRKNLSLGEGDKSSLQRKIEELTSQNQELAKAVAGQFKRDQDLPIADNEGGNVDLFADYSTPESSPPPSPSKGTPRHSMLESETLKSSLHHAQRMIQNLKGNIHREKTEKIDLKRMLQEARDELEIRRGDGEVGGSSTSAGKRRKLGAEKDNFKKPAKPNLLGAGRNSKNEVFVDENGWEDHSGERSPGRSVPSRPTGPDAGAGVGLPTDTSDAFETAAESTDAFETANEREGATDEFQTSDGLAGDSSDEQTETERGITRGDTVRVKHQSNLTKPRNRDSFMSTASTSADEEDVRSSIPPQQRLRLKINRGSGFRRSKVAGGTPPHNIDPNSAKDSPASFMSNQSQADPRPQSLFAELGGLEGSDDSDEGHEVADGTPSRSSLPVQSSTAPGSRHGAAKASWPANKEPSTAPIRPKVEMVDTATMTEPIEPATAGQVAVNQGSRRSPFVDGLAAGVAYVTGQKAEDAIQSIETSHEVAGQLPFTPTKSENDLTPVRSVEDAPHQVDAETPKDTIAKRNTEGQDSPYSPASLTQTQPGGTIKAQADTVPPTTELTQARSVPLSPSESAAEVPLAFSSIQSQATEPTEQRPRSPLSPEVQAKRMGAVFAGTEAENLVSKHDTERTDQPETPKPGFFGSIFGRNKSPAAPSPPQIAEDEGTRTISQNQVASSDPEKLPFKDLSNNIGQRELKKDSAAANLISHSADMADQASQTLLSSEQIDSLMRENAKKSMVIAAEEGSKAMPNSLSRPPAGASSTGSFRGNKSQDTLTGVKGRNRVPEPVVVREESAASKTLRRPASAGSVRSSLGTHPPLPPDHKQAIAAASQRVSSVEPPTGQMGPPSIPASAYRSSNSQYRPRTPTSQYQSSVASRGGTTPRPRASTGRSDLSSPNATRRSSFSSFASELDERFNIRTGGMIMPQGLEGPGTDPRMIQAITQTMIGEYLWKYTRKAGRGQMSANRHRRFFWVHPYTRTLYWSDQDPATAGRAELKAKSVAIEAVSVVSDDNPMPPGLHRKSLVIITPGRSVKFTAATGQRHETWFNSLSYLLLRTGAERGAYGYENPDPSGQALTNEDVDEFNPSLSRNRGAAASLSSYHSHTTRNDSPSRNVSSLSHRPRIEKPTLARPDSAAQSQRNQGSISRLSNMFRNPRPSSTFRGSFSSRRSRHSQADASIYNASEVPDSAEDLREVMEQQERDADRLENVRACCDGKHDVSTLTKKGRHGSTNSRHSHVHTYTHHQHQPSQGTLQQQTQEAVQQP